MAQIATLARQLRSSARPLGRCCTLAAIGTAIALSPKPDAATFTYTNPACASFTVSGTPPNQTVTCVTSVGGGVPVCTPSANPASPAIGQATTVSANCTNQPSLYMWTGGGCTASGAGTTCSVMRKRAGTVNFTITASNASGTGPTAQLSVTWK